MLAETLSPQKLDIIGLSVLKIPDKMLIVWYLHQHQDNLGEPGMLNTSIIVYYQQEHSWSRKKCYGEHNFIIQF
jgi:hypothetical protein